MTSPSKPRRIADVDVPLTRLEADARALTVRRCCQVLAEAAASTESPSDRIAYALDECLLRHPEAPISTDDTYPGWAEHIAALAAKNQQPRRLA
ncbi:hypothetical protein U9R90_05495 [Streptomyces sp. E11-3]|uniref:hypothetical protein n=1 Tax=Streptomyces sp. E11-3 TaxID=3110112 RepID=UPI0039807B44